MIFLELLTQTLSPHRGEVGVGMVEDSRASPLSAKNHPGGSALAEAAVLPIPGSC